ncbi:MAG TPA: RsmD family RNA methyltransferase [Candidatus Eisenbacteria bacterium]|jgi:tRNA G10  N-methylase Trm11|nr:RsmD family RNA methyltransferase [Candidatus Eisenbacteria bacterium]
MRYFFILGTNPVLSTAEIIALLDGRQFTVTEMYKQAVIVDAMPGHTLDAKALMARLGGTIKIGTVLAEGLAQDADTLEEQVLQGLSDRVANIGNATYGISVYSLESDKPASKAATLSGKFKDVGMRVKRKLQAAGCAARWVKAQVGTALTSAAVGKNNMLMDGAEFIVLAKADTMIVGKTDVIQPFEEFSLVDYGRPERDTIQGMLPPKLARIMINLIHVSREVVSISIMDPFCGSGTVLTEALQMGFRELYGSDKNPAAVVATQKNIDWLKEKGLVSGETNHVALFASDARQIGQQMKPKTLDAIVTEPYLGPNRTGGERRGELQKRLSELTKLYYESLSAWRPLLKPGAPIVMAMPVYILGNEKHGISAKDFENLGYRTEAMLPGPILSRLGVPETKNHGLMYGRNDQHVWREIVRLRLAE